MFHRCLIFNAHALIFNDRFMPTRDPPPPPSCVQLCACLRQFAVVGGRGFTGPIFFFKFMRKYSRLYFLRIFMNTNFIKMFYLKKLQKLFIRSFMSTHLPQLSNLMVTVWYYIGGQAVGATTLSITTLSITTLSITIS